MSTTSPYAVIVTGGKQYRVKVGQNFKFEKLDGQPGDAVVFDQVLMVADGEAVEIGTPHLPRAVKGEILSNGRGKKIEIIKFRRRKKYRRKQGHRQAYTEVKITAIEAA